MKKDLSELRALIAHVAPEAPSMDDEALAVLEAVRLPLVLDKGRARLPSPAEISGMPVTTTIVDRLGDDHAFSVAITDILKKAALPAAQAVHSFVRLDPVEGGLSVLEVLGIISSRFSFLDRQQLAICRAILLIMDNKKDRVLLEKGASLAEIKAAMTSQKEDVPIDLESQLQALVKTHVLEVESGLLEDFYKVVH